MLRASGYTPVIKGMIFMQGEAETFKDYTANAYGELLTDFINDIRYNLATGSSATSHLLLIDKYDEISTGHFRAQQFDCSISISSYGGDGGATPTISFKVSANGTPKLGYATITSGTPTFVENVSA